MMGTVAVAFISAFLSGSSFAQGEWPLGSLWLVGALMWAGMIVWAYRDLSKEIRRIQERAR